MRDVKRYGLPRLIALVFILTAAAAEFSCSHTSNDPEPGSADIASRQDRAPGEYLVTLVPGAGRKVIEDLYGSYGIKGIKDLGGNLFLVILTEDPGPADMDELRKRNAGVKAVQPNFVYRANGLRSTR